MFIFLINIKLHKLTIIVYHNNINIHFYFKVNHDKRLKLMGCVNNKMHQKSNVSCLNLKSPTEKESYTIVSSNNYILNKIFIMHYQ